MTPRERRAEGLILAGLTLLAVLPRVWDLDGIPPGIHGDEAQFAMDAQQVLERGWIGPYTKSALGQPSGIAYVIAIGQWGFGPTTLGARLGVALFASLAVPLTYLLFRLLTCRIVALMTALLLAASLWHLHFSRVAYQPALVPTVVASVLVLWTLALQRGNACWFALAGAVLGAGLYTYNVYPAFVVVFALWVAVYTMVFERGPRFRGWAGKVTLAATISIIAGLPLFLYIADPQNDYFHRYSEYYRRFSVFQSPEFQEGDLGQKLGIAAAQAWVFVGAYGWRGITDFVDGSGPDGRPMFDPLTTALVVVGTLYAARRWRETPHLLSLMMIGIVPLATIFQTEAIYRGPLGIVPFLCFLAALPLALAWRNAGPVRPLWRRLIRGGVVLAFGFIACGNLDSYFRSWAKSPVFSWVYARQISAASRYVDSLPNRPYVYFYSGRWSFDYETRQYLAPHARGEDRSRQFGRRRGLEIDRSNDSLFLLLPPYLTLRDEIRRLYPEGGEVVRRHDGEILFVAYHVPALLSPDAAGLR